MFKPFLSSEVLSCMNTPLPYECFHRWVLSMNPFISFMYPNPWIRICPLWALPIMKLFHEWYVHILDTLEWVYSEDWVFSFMNPSFYRSFCFIVISCPGTFPLWIVTIHGFRFLYRSYSYSIYCTVPIRAWCSFINETFYSMESSQCIFSHHGTFLLRVLSYHRVLPSVSCHIRESFSV